MCKKILQKGLWSTFDFALCFCLLSSDAFHQVFVTICPIHCVIAQKMPKHRSYTVEFKLSVIKWHKEKGESIRKTAREYQIDRKRIREWLKQEDELNSNSRGSDAKKRRISHGGEVISHEVDFGVLDYLLSLRERGIPVYNIDIKDKALEIARDLAEGNSRLSEFKASDGWLRCWKKRNRIALLKGTDEAMKIPEDYRYLIKGFVTDVKRKRVQHQYNLHNIGKMASLLTTMLGFSIQNMVFLGQWLELDKFTFSQFKSEKNWTKLKTNLHDI